MPFARIITRFDAGAHELALLLLERGYAVEIVSPDSIPDNFADLELRLDNPSSDELISNVKAHSSGHSAAFDFVHRLKTPIGDFPVVHEAFRPLEIPVTGNAEPGFKEPEPVAVVPEVAAPDPIVEPGPVTPEASTISISPAVAATTLACEPPPRSRSAWLYGRAALACAGIVLLALFLLFGIRPSGTGEVQSSSAVDSSKVAAAAGVDALRAVDDVKEPQNQLEKDPARAPGISSVADAPLTVKSEGKSMGASGKSPVPKIAADAGSSKPRSRSGSSGRHGDGLIARDTVTYLDGRYRPAQKTKSQSRVARRQPSSHKHGGVIAANNVTYLDTKPNSQPAK